MNTFEQGRRRLLGGSLGLAAAAWSGSARADYPERPIRLLVPLATGGATDVVARAALAPTLATLLGQQIVVENITGAGGQIAYETLARARPDGYTLLLATISGTVFRLVNKSYTLDMASDFAPITRVEERPLWLAVPRSLPVQNIQEFVAYAKANPGKLNYGSGGTIDILAAEWMHKVAGIRTTIVRYRGGAPAVQALLANDIQYHWDVASVLKPFVDSGQLRVIASSGRKRYPDFPNVGSVADAYPEFTYGSWNGLLAPKGTPPAVIDRLYAAVRDTLARPEVVQRLNQLGTEPAVSASPADFTRALRQESDRWAVVAQAARIVAD